MPLSLEIVTPERRVAQLTCDEVRAPGTQGGFGVRPGHASFMSGLEPGRLTVVSGGREEHFAVGGGFLQVDRDRVMVLADSAERREEIDVDRAERAFDEATERSRSVASSKARAPRHGAARRRGPLTRAA